MNTGCTFYPECFPSSLTSPSFELSYHLTLLKILTGVLGPLPNVSTTLVLVYLLNIKYVLNPCLYHTPLTNSFTQSPHHPISAEGKSFLLLRPQSLIFFSFVTSLTSRVTYLPSHWLSQWYHLLASVTFIRVKEVSPTVLFLFFLKMY